MEKTKERIAEANKFFNTISTDVSSKEEKLRWFMVN